MASISYGGRSVRSLGERLRRLPPVVRAGAAQLVALMVAALMWSLQPAPLGQLAWAVAVGGLAALFGYRFGLASWWIPIQAAFMPAIAVLLPLGIPASWFLAGFVLLTLVYWTTFRTQVPLFLSSPEVREKLGELLPERPGFSFVDLGCGLGGVLAGLAERRPDGRYHGVELAPLPWLVSWLRSRVGASDCRISWGSFWKLDLARYDVVYAYLSPVPMAELWHKVRREMRPGSLFISNAFAVPGAIPTQIVTVDGSGGTTLYVWRL